MEVINKNNINAHIKYTNSKILNIFKYIKLDIFDY